MIDSFCTNNSPFQMNSLLHDFSLPSVETLERNEESTKIDSFGLMIS